MPALRAMQGYPLPTNDDQGVLSVMAQFVEVRTIGHFAVIMSTIYAEQAIDFMHEHRAVHGVSGHNACRV